MWSMTSYTMYNFVIINIWLADDVVRTAQSLQILVVEYILHMHIHMAQKQSYNAVAIDYTQNESNDTFALKSN